MAIELEKPTRYGGTGDYWILSNIQYDLVTASVIYTYLQYVSAADCRGRKSPCNTVTVRDNLDTADIPNNILDIDAFVVATSATFLGGTVVNNP